MKLHYNIPEGKSLNIQMDNDPTLRGYSNKRMNTRNLRRITLLMTLLWAIMVLEVGKNIHYFSNNTWALYVSIF